MYYTFNSGSKSDRLCACCFQHIDITRSFFALFHDPIANTKMNYFAEKDRHRLVLCLILNVLVLPTADSFAQEKHDFMVVFPTLVDGNDVMLSIDVRSFNRLRTLAYPHFQAFGRNFTLHLHQNHELLANEFTIETIPYFYSNDAIGQSYDQDYDVSGHESEGNRKTHEGLKSRNCYFIGFVKDDFNSSVAIDACNGLSGVIVVSNEEFYIEPISIHADYDSNRGFPHAIYKRSWMNLPNVADDDLLVSFENWSDDSTFPYVTVDDGSSSLSHDLPAVSPRRGQRSLRHTPNIETLVVVDKTMVDFHGEKNVKDYVLTVMNMVSNIFRDPSIGEPINVVIVRLVIVEKQKSDSFTVSFSAKTTLQSFCAWQKRHNVPGDHNPYHHDVAILFTRKDICGVGNFPCGSIGMAMQGGMCSNRYSCSIVQDTGLNTAFTVAQMLGHNLGLVSLKRTVCDVLGAGAYIMSPRRLKSPHTNRFKWSSCSRNQLVRFLKGRSGRCLLDEADVNEKHNFTLPGQQYDLDSQCKFVHGKNSTFCFGALENVCKTLWCMQENRRKGCTTNREPAAEGSFCNYEKTKWCIGGQCIPKVSKTVPVDGQWGTWSQWSMCSRTCGSGVIEATRDCNSPRPAYKGKSCVGERKRYRMCNPEKCSTDSISFRDAQCAKFNSRPYRGRFYKWKGFHLKAKECSLVCRSERHRFYALMSLNAVDGTPCRPGSYDRCIDGQCKKVGCDNVIGSNMKDDLCGKCGGNNTDCLLISKNFKKKHGIGYVTVDYIPRGSTSIRIVEKRPSRNYLALETNFGVNVINAGYMIERSGMHHRLNSIVEYKRTGLFEQIYIKGPISEDIKIMVLFQADTSSIAYQFAEQNNANRAQFKSRDRYIWKHDNTSRNAWSACSATCGRGLHHGKFDCFDIFRNNVVDENLCDKSEKPLFVRPCENLPLCEKLTPTGSWKVGKWSACSVTCSHGVKIRTVSCTNPKNNVELKEEICKDKKPRTIKKCKRVICPKEMGIWVFGQWGVCSRTCGEGIRKRLVKCMNLAGKMLDKSQCDSNRKPAMVDRCGSPCAKWVAGEWGQCPSSCKEKQKRCILCINMHNFTPSKECDLSEKPAEERNCSLKECS